MKPIIGIITCGFADDRQFVSQAYIRAVELAGGAPLLLPAVRSGSIYPCYHSVCSGYLFCGGDDITPILLGKDPLDASGHTDLLTDRFQLSFMKFVLSDRKPVLAVCRGMQLLNAALGGTIYQDLSLREKTSIQHMQNSLKRQDVSHRVFFQKGSMMHRLFGPSACTNSFHHQAVNKPGKHVAVSGRTNDGVIESIELTDRPFAVGVQWHPECMFSTSLKMRRLFHAFLLASQKNFS